VDMKLEVVVVPVSDVDKAKNFYQELGNRRRRSPGRQFFTNRQSLTKERPVRVIFDSAGDLAQALRRAADAHGKHEEQIGHADPDWPDWYAQYMAQEQAGRPAPAGQGTSG